MLRTLLGVAVGGALGSLCRYGLVRWLASANPHPSFSMGILAANLIGCFLVGVIYARVQLLEPTAREMMTAFLLTGFMGGLTTFSSYALELFHMSYDGAWRWATLYFVIHLLVGLTAVAAGLTVGRGLGAG